MNPKAHSVRFEDPAEVPSECEAERGGECEPPLSRLTPTAPSVREPENVRQKPKGFSLRRSSAEGGDEVYESINKPSLRCKAGL